MHIQHDFPNLWSTTTIWFCWKNKKNKITYDEWHRKNINMLAFRYDNKFINVVKFYEKGQKKLKLSTFYF